MISVRYLYSIPLPRLTAQRAAIDWKCPAVHHARHSQKKRNAGRRILIDHTPHIRKEKDCRTWLSFEGNQRTAAVQQPGTGEPLTCHHGHRNTKHRPDYNMIIQPFPDRPEKFPFYGRTGRLQPGAGPPDPDPTGPPPSTPWPNGGKKPAGEPFPSPEGF